MSHIHNWWLSMFTGFPVSPKNTTVSVDPSGPVLEGNSVTLTCNSHANPAVTNYTWYRVDGDDEDMSESGPTLVIDRADPSHSGEYYCGAKNDHGEEKSTPFQLDVQCEFMFHNNNTDWHFKQKTLYISSDFMQWIWPNVLRQRLHKSSCGYPHVAWCQTFSLRATLQCLDHGQAPIVVLRDNLKSFLCQ